MPSPEELAQQVRPPANPTRQLPRRVAQQVRTFPVETTPNVRSPTSEPTELPQQEHQEVELMCSCGVAFKPEGNFCWHCGASKAQHLSQKKKHIAAATKETIDTNGKPVPQGRKLQPTYASGVKGQADAWHDLLNAAQVRAGALNSRGPSSLKTHSSKQSTADGSDTCDPWWLSEATEDFSCASEGTDGMEPQRHVSNRMEPQPRPSGRNDMYGSERFGFQPQNRPKADECITTLMICGIPCRQSAGDMVNVMKDLGFANTFDMLYVPYQKDRRKGGYAFVNFKTATSAAEFARVYPNEDSKQSYTKPAQIQGFEANVAQHWRCQQHQPGSLLTFSNN
jgi:hypothetical protein